jgi:inner membrane protein
VSNIFIIDPLYTLPLLIAIVAGLVSKTSAGRWCKTMVLLSTLYLGWGYVAQQIISERVEDNLRAQQLPTQNIMVMPTPFNTVLWRVVVLDDGQYWEGLASLLDSNAHIDFTPRTLGSWPISEQSRSLEGLKKFSHNYLNYREESGELIVTDLRLGMADTLAFQFVLAEKDERGEWKLLDSPKRYPSERSFEQIGLLWKRLKGDQTIDANLKRLELSLVNQ